jgi:bacterioferritin (cytochrome b1)
LFTLEGNLSFIDYNQSRSHINETGGKMYEKNIELLNKAVADELSAVHQYMYFHFHCEDQGFELLASQFIKTEIE